MYGHLRDVARGGLLRPPVPDHGLRRPDVAEDLREGLPEVRRLAALRLHGQVRRQEDLKGLAAVGRQAAVEADALVLVVQDLRQLRVAPVAAAAGRLPVDVVAVEGLVEEEDRDVGDGAQVDEIDELVPVKHAQEPPRH